METPQPNAPIHFSKNPSSTFYNNIRYLARGTNMTLTPTEEYIALRFHKEDDDSKYAQRMHDGMCKINIKIPGHYCQDVYLFDKSEEYIIGAAIFGGEKAEFTISLLIGPSLIVGYRHCDSLP